MNEDLLKSFTGEEIESVVNGFHSTKSPSPDGFPTVFFQKYWDIVGNKTIVECLDILNHDR